MFELHQRVSPKEIIVGWYVDLFQKELCFKLIVILLPQLPSLHFIHLDVVYVSINLCERINYMPVSEGCRAACKQ
jgi:hypothetical protein